MLESLEDVATRHRQTLTYEEPFYLRHDQRQKEMHTSRAFIHSHVKYHNMCIHLPHGDRFVEQNCYYYYTHEKHTYLVFN